jgi:hypothetical protein
VESSQLVGLAFIRHDWTRLNGLAEIGYTRVRRVAQEAAPFNIVLEARP